LPQISADAGGASRRGSGNPEDLEVQVNKQAFQQCRGLFFQIGNVLFTCSRIRNEEENLVGLQKNADSGFTATYGYMGRPPGQLQGFFMICFFETAKNIFSIPYAGTIVLYAPFTPNRTRSIPMARRKAFSAGDKQPSAMYGVLP
jgi:hypothetical protein